MSYPPQQQFYPQPQRRSVPTWLIAVLTGGGLVVVACCGVPCLLSMLSQPLAKLSEDVKKESTARKPVPARKPVDTFDVRVLPATDQEKKEFAKEHVRQGFKLQPATLWAVDAPNHPGIRGATAQFVVAYVDAPDGTENLCAWWRAGYLMSSVNDAALKCSLYPSGKTHKKPIWQDAEDCQQLLDYAKRHKDSG